MTEHVQTRLAEAQPAPTTGTPTSAGPPPSTPGGRLTPRERAGRALSLLGSLQGYIGLVAVIVFGLATEGQTFWNQTNLTNAIGAYATRGILAVGETLVIITAGIDLSVGSMLGLASMAAAMLVSNHNMSPFAVVPICMAIGAGFGLLNGIGSTWFKVQSFVMTLATLNIIRGIDKQVSNNVDVSVQQVGANGKLTPNSAAFAQLGTPGQHLFGSILGYWPVLALLIVVVVFQLILSKSRFGRHIYAVGGNATAAKLSGVNVTLVTIAVFTLAGMLAGFAGPIDAAYAASADPLAGQSYELDAIAAAVIGGASLRGGRGTVVGTLVGALILTLLDNVLGLNGVSDNLQLIIKGVIVVAAVIIQRPGWVRDLAAGARRLGQLPRPGRS